MFEQKKSISENELASSIICKGQNEMVPGIFCSIESMTIQELEIAIERTWYHHLELRNELYDLEMGPCHILDVYVSCQKTVRPSLTKTRLEAMMRSNFDYHFKLRAKFYNINNMKSPEKRIIM